MKTWIAIIVLLVLVVAAGEAAVWFFDLRLPPSAADRERAHAVFAEAQIHVRSGDYPEALRLLDDTITLDPQADALRARASLLVSQRAYERAEKDLSRVVSAGDANAADYSLRCWLRARNDNALRQARDDCDRALELNPDLASAYGSRGLVGLKQGRYRDAWNDFNTGLRVGGDGEEAAWRVFGRGLASWHQGDTTQGRSDIQMALHSNPHIAAQFAEFGLGGEALRSFDDAAYAAAIEDPSLASLQTYLVIYPSGAHAVEVQTMIKDIDARIVTEIAAGRQSIAGFSLVQVRGDGPDSDSFGAIGLSRSSRRTAFSTDYATPEEAVRAAEEACNGTAAPDCEAFAFRNVCAALSLSPESRARGMAWAYTRDFAVDASVGQCRQQGGANCAPVHVQCTPTPDENAASAARL